jgi:hypothetical protein
VASGGICQVRLGSLSTNTGFSTYLNYGSSVSHLTAFLVLSHE